MKLMTVTYSSIPSTTTYSEAKFANMVCKVPILHLFPPMLIALLMLLPVHVEKDKTMVNFIDLVEVFDFSNDNQF